MEARGYQGCWDRAVKRQLDELGNTANGYITDAMFHEEIAKEKRGRFLFAAVFVVIGVGATVLLLLEIVKSL